VSSPQGKGAGAGQAPAREAGGTRTAARLPQGPGASAGGTAADGAALATAALLDCGRLVATGNVEDIGRRQLPELLQLLRGRVLQHAMDPHGCRAVQRALELADEEDQRQLVQELRGHVYEALESPHANHVLQRAVTLLRPSAVGFVLEELLHRLRPAALARHPYGCRVLERLIEHFPPAWLSTLVDEVVEEAMALCRHAYGNFVLQHLLEHGDPETRRRIIAALERDISEVATHQSACGVLDKALSYGHPEDQCQLAERVLLSDGLIVAMGSQRNGFAATQRLLKVVTGPLLEAALAQLAAGADKLQRSKHGRALISAVWPDAGSSPVSNTALPPGRVRRGSRERRQGPVP